MECDLCLSEFTRTKKNVIASRKRNNGNDVCASCAARIATRPQNSTNYWTPEKKLRHAEKMRNSDACQLAWAEQSERMRGSNNPRYRVQVGQATRDKMSASRTGKVGKNATAWKGGKESLNKRVKRAIQRRHKWFARVLDRAQGLCEVCGEKATEAHHIVPMARLIKEALSGKDFASDDERLLWLMDQPKIIDIGLVNGQAVCRPCHRKAHGTWGSHRP